MGLLTFQFAGSTSLGGRIIEWYDHGRFAHVDTVLADGTLFGARDDKYKDIPAGVQARPADYLSSDVYTFRVKIPCSDEQESSYHAFLTAQFGKPYDESAIAGFVAGRNWYKTGEWFCSELNTAGLIAAGIIKPLVAPANKVAPDDLLLVLSSLIPITLPPIQ